MCLMLSGKFKNRSSRKYYDDLEFDLLPLQLAGSLLIYTVDSVVYVPLGYMFSSLGDVFL